MNSNYPKILEKNRKNKFKSYSAVSWFKFMYPKCSGSKKSFSLIKFFTTLSSDTLQFWCLSHSPEAKGESRKFTKLWLRSRRICNFSQWRLTKKSFLELNFFKNNVFWRHRSDGIQGFSPKSPTENHFPCSFTDRIAPWLGRNGLVGRTNKILYPPSRDPGYSCRRRNQAN